MITSNCIVCGKECSVGGSTPRKYCSIDCKAEWQRSLKPVTRDWLYQKYIVEELSATDIAALVNRNSKRVWEWLRDYGIPTRPRGATTSKGGFKAGQESPFKGKKHTPENRERFRQLSLADGRVPYLKDGKHHLEGKRGAETPNWKGGVTPERQACYSSVEWADAVKAVWARDNAICQRCGLDHRTIDRNETGFDIHHITSFAVKELRCEVSNLVLLCEPCHYFVHSKKNTKGEFLK